MYHDPRWLRRELKRFGSLSSLCRAYDLAESTVVSYLKRHPEVKKKVEDLLKRPQSLLNQKRPRDVGQIRLATLRRYKEVWTLEELKEAGLPLYWNPEWLLEQLIELRSLGAVCKRYGYKANTVQRYISRRKDLVQRIYEAREHMREIQTPILIHLPPALAERVSAAKTQREVVVDAIRRAIKKAQDERQKQK